MTRDSLHEYVLSFPGVTQDIKWEDHLCFLIGDKMFLMDSLHGDWHPGFKVTPEEFDLLIERPGIEPMPYMARNKWIAVNDPDALSNEEWRRFVRQSYELINPGCRKKCKGSWMRLSRLSELYFEHATGMEMIRRMIGQSSFLSFPSPLRVQNIKNHSTLLAIKKRRL